MLCGGIYCVIVKGFLSGNKKDPYLLSLIYELCMHAEVPREDADRDIECDTPFHPLKVKGVYPRTRRKERLV